MLDEPQQAILPVLEEVFAFIARCKEQNGRVLVMSERGQSRSAALVIAHIMFQQGLSYLEAFTFVKDRRYSIEPNRGFKRQLCEWYHSFVAVSLVFSLLTLFVLQVARDARGRPAHAHCPAVSSHGHGYVPGAIRIGSLHSERSLLQCSSIQRSSPVRSTRDFAAAAHNAQPRRHPRATKAEPAHVLAAAAAAPAVRPVDLFVYM
jgi:hypothetical protein